MKLYGIKSCDTVKKARKWLEKNNIPFEFHDVRADGLELDTIHQWLQQVGSETLLNKRSTTWKNLDTAVKEALLAEDIPTLLQNNPTLIKRPVLEYKKSITVGFKEAIYNEVFSDKIR